MVLIRDILLCSVEFCTPFALEMCRYKSATSGAL
ncbi:MAG: hypothetical protein ACD_8C00069G0002, partial [uncultured bacterium]